MLTFSIIGALAMPAMPVAPSFSAEIPRPRLVWHDVTHDVTLLRMLTFSIIGALAMPVAPSVSAEIPRPRLVRHDVAMPAMPVALGGPRFQLGLQGMILRAC